MIKVTEDLVLVPIGLEHVQEFYELTDRSRSYLKEWLPWLDYIKGPEDTRTFIAGRLEAAVKYKGRPLQFVILDQGEIAGTLGFNEIHQETQTGEIGYWLGEGFQGKGLMARSARALISYGFDGLHLEKMVIKAASGNKKSRALPEKLGFKEIGYRKDAEWLYDHYVDHVLYELKKKVPVTVRKVLTEDAQGFLGLQLALDSETSFMMFEPGERVGDFKRLESFIASFQDETGLLLGAESHQELVGFMMAQRGSQNRIKHSAYVVIGIRKAFQGQGIGTSFFEELDKWAKELQLKRLELTVMVPNEAGLALYLKSGFEIEGIKRASMFVNGEFVDEYYMSKIL